MKLTYKCPICDKQLKLVEEIQLGTERLYFYACGHTFARPQTTVGQLDFRAIDGSDKHARPYQETGVEFVIESDFNCILADQMRLGKTPQSLLAYKNRMVERTPCLEIVGGANLWQWIREHKTWADPSMNGIYPILGSTAFIPPGFKTYIVSRDTFAKPKMLEALKKIAFKLVIVDEAHSFKNSSSNRSRALIDFLASQNTGEVSKNLHFKCVQDGTEWDEIGTQKFDKRIGHVSISKSSKCPKCGHWAYQSQGSPQSDETSPEDKPCGCILITGTPILNRAQEYFVPLNIVAPEKFSSLDRFKREWLEQDTQVVNGVRKNKTTWSRISPRKLDAFKEIIKPYVLRREKEDVYKDTPPLNKMYTLIEPDKDLLSKQYNAILDRLDLKIADKVNFTYWDAADELMELRRICGLMKVMWVSDYLESCTIDNPTTKWAVGIHHESVRDVLYLKLGGESNCIKFSGADNSERKDWIMRHWESNPQQYLIINMLAGAEGCDFHYCDNVVVLERGWNSEKESQFEYRFYNPDTSIKNRPTNIEYILARGTLDEWWHDMVEEKRAAVGEIVYTHWDLQQDTNMFHDLVERTVAGRL